MRLLVIAIALVACGRIGFDPHADASADAADPPSGVITIAGSTISPDFTVATAIAGIK